MSRYFVHPNQIDGDIIRIIRKDDLHHIKTVMRMRVGDPIEVSDGQKWEYEGILGLQDNEGLKVEVIHKQPFFREPKVRITLFQGIPKQGKMDFLIQKAVEMGVFEVVPVFMARTIVADRGNFGKKLLRFQLIAEEAASQSGRGIIPFIRQPIPFQKITESLNNFGMVLFLYENEQQTTIKEVLHRLTEIPENVALIVGPEGGFSPEEVKILREMDTTCVTLGKTILRTETAGLAALAMCMYELEL